MTGSARSHARGGTGVTLLTAVAVAAAVIAACLAAAFLVVRYMVID